MKLPADQKLKVEKFLKKAIDREQGLEVSDSDESEGDTEGLCLCPCLWSLCVYMILWVDSNRRCIYVKVVQQGC